MLFIGLAAPGIESDVALTLVAIKLSIVPAAALTLPLSTIPPIVPDVATSDGYDAFVLDKFENVPLGADKVPVLMLPATALVRRTVPTLATLALKLPSVTALVLAKSVLILAFPRVVDVQKIDPSVASVKFAFPILAFPIDADDDTFNVLDWSSCVVSEPNDIDVSTTFGIVTVLAANPPVIIAFVIVTESSMLPPLTNTFPTVISPHSRIFTVHESTLSEPIVDGDDKLILFETISEAILEELETTFPIVELIRESAPPSTSTPIDAFPAASPPILPTLAMTFVLLASVPIVELPVIAFPKLDSPVNIAFPTRPLADIPPLTTSAPAAVLMLCVVSATSARVLLTANTTASESSTATRRSVLILLL